MRNTDATLSRQHLEMLLDHGDSQILTDALQSTLCSPMTPLRAMTLPGPTLLLLSDQHPGAPEGYREGTGLQRHPSSTSAHPRFGKWRTDGDAAIICSVKAVLPSKQIWKMSQYDQIKFLVEDLSIMLVCHFRICFYYAGSWSAVCCHLSAQWCLTVCAPIIDIFIDMNSCTCIRVFLVFVLMSSLGLVSIRL